MELTGHLSNLCVYKAFLLGTTCVDPKTVCLSCSWQLIASDISLDERFYVYSCWFCCLHSIIHVCSEQSMHCKKTLLGIADPTQSNEYFLMDVCAMFDDVATSTGINTLCVEDDYNRFHTAMAGKSVCAYWTPSILAHACQNLFRIAPRGLRMSSGKYIRFIYIYMLKGVHATAFICQRCPCLVH